MKNRNWNKAQQVSKKAWLHTHSIYRGFRSDGEPINRDLRKVPGGGLVAKSSRRSLNAVRKSKRPISLAPINLKD